MSDLIKREDALSWLRGVSNTMPGEIDHRGMAVFSNLRTAMIESIGYCKTVDAVEVVRCQECKHWTACDNGSSTQMIGRTDGSCRMLLKQHDAYAYMTERDHFCGYGERRPNET